MHRLFPESSWWLVLTTDLAFSLPKKKSTEGWAEPAHRTFADPHRFYPLPVPLCCLVLVDSFLLEQE